MIASILLIVSGLLLITLCLGVFLSNSKKPVNRALTGFLLSGFLWLISNFLANISNSESASLFFTRSTLVGAALIPLAFLSFAVIYTGRRKFTKAFFLRIALLPAILILLTPTSWNITSVDPQGRNAIAGPLYLLEITVLITYFSYGIYALAKSYKRALSIEKSQLQYIFVGLVITLIPGIITNGILPIFGSSGSSAYGPVAVVGFSLFTTIAIVRHRLLDIRLVVARSLAYIFVLGTLGVTFGALLLTISSVFFPENSVSTGIKIIYVIVALLLALAYQPLKRYFDKLTNRIFYRDAYDPQEVLDKISNFLVGTVNLKQIEVKTNHILSSTVKTSSVSFLLKTAEKPEDKKLMYLLTETHSEIIAFDSIEQNREKHLHTEMDTRNAAIAIRLKTTEGILGYMLLGFKQSGASYSEADIRLLGTAADEIAIGLQSALRFEEIQQFNITLQEKIEEATKQLRHANHRLRELDATKDEFISMASHQLRTPLTTIKGYLSMVLEGDVGPVTKNEKQMIQQAFDSAERMVFLIADLLNVSRLQSGKFVIDNKPTDLAKMIDTEVKQLKDTAEHHHLTLTYKKPEKFPLLNLDDTKIRQVVMNFMDNAIFYTPAEGSIEVALEATDSEIRYTVTDTGLGVPKEEQHHLFSKFFRAGNARKMRPDGTGLGLFMAKKVIVAQGGAVIFKSTEGKGSTFGFSFPRKAVELKEGTPKEKPQEATPEPEKAIAAK